MSAHILSQIGESEHGRERAGLPSARAAVPGERAEPRGVRPPRGRPSDDGRVLPQPAGAGTDAACGVQRAGPGTHRQRPASRRVGRSDERREA